MSRRRENDDAKPEERTSSDQDGRSEAQLDEALEDSFPASDPVSAEHSDHAGAPPGHDGTARGRTPPDRKPD
jgi:hypothetical protein